MWSALFFDPRPVDARELITRRAHVLSNTDNDAELRAPTPVGREQNADPACLARNGHGSPRQGTRLTLLPVASESGLVPHVQAGSALDAALVDEVGSERAVGDERLGDDAVSVTRDELELRRTFGRWLLPRLAVWTRCPR